MRESDNVNTCYLIQFLVVSFPNLPHLHLYVIYRKKYTDLWKKVLGFRAKVTPVKHIGASSGKIYICLRSVLVLSFRRRSNLGAFVTKPLSIYDFARTWAVVAANSMVEELQVAQVPALLFSVKQIICNIVSSCLISQLNLYADDTYGCR